MYPRSLNSMISRLPGPPEKGVLLKNGACKLQRRKIGRLGTRSQPEGQGMGWKVPWVCSMGPPHRSWNPKMVKADPRLLDQEVQKGGS